MESLENDNYHFSVIVTQRCNLQCSYCHFYHSEPRLEARSDISDNLFDSYLCLIKQFAAKINRDVSFRFSGGDPIVLSGRLFDLAARAFQFVGTKPYVLTGGKGLTPEWVQKAERSGIGQVLVSLENPLDPDPGSEDPFEIMKLIKRLSSASLPISLGSTIVRNRSFKDLFEICLIVYNELGIIPNLQELNYQVYETPTKEELQQLYSNVYQIVCTFGRKVDLNLFPYVSPEFTAVHGGKTTYLMELGIHNPYKLTQHNIDQTISQILEKRAINYPGSGCRYRTCPWFSGCQSIKWLWKAPSANVSPEQKLRDYCRFKRAINQAFYDAVLDNGW